MRKLQLRTYEEIAPGDLIITLRTFQLCISNTVMSSDPDFLKITVLLAGYSRNPETIKHIIVRQRTLINVSDTLIISNEK